MAFHNVPPNGFPDLPDVEELAAVEKDVKTLKTTTAEQGAAITALGTAKAAKADIAPTFSAESNYAVGDLVYYDGALYECTTDHEAAAWDADDFTAASIDDELSSLKSGLTNTDNKATTAYNSRISISTFFDDSIDKIITFSGKAYCRRASFLLIPASQSSVYAPIVISFTGTAGYDNTDGVVVSANTCGVTANGLTVTAPKLDGGWGYYTLINLYPDAELTYTVTAAS